LLSAANDNLKDDLIRYTRQVWQPRLGRDLSREDARQIAENLTGFFADLPRGYLPPPRSARFGRSEGPIAGRQVVRRRDDAQTLPTGGVLFAHRNERPGVGLLQRAAATSSSRHLRGRRHGLGLRNLPDPFPAFRRSPPI